MAQMVENPPTGQETQVQSLGLEDPLEKEMATHSSILTWEIPWTEEPGGLQSVGSQESDTTDWLTHTPQGQSLSRLILWRLICRLPYRNTTLQGCQRKEIYANIPTCSIKLKSPWGNPTWHRMFLDHSCLSGPHFKERVISKSFLAWAGTLWA